MSTVQYTPPLQECSKKLRRKEARANFVKCYFASLLLFINIFYRHRNIQNEKLGVLCTGKICIVSVLSQIQPACVMQLNSRGQVHSFSPDQEQVECSALESTPISYQACCSADSAIHKTPNVENQVIGLFRLKTIDLLYLM